MKRHKCSLPVLSIAVVTLCLMLSIVGCGPQPKSLQGSQDKSLRVPKDESLKESFIAFVRHGQIWTARADGTEQKQLTGGKDSSPAVSPDGKTIIYTHDDTIFAIPSAGGNPVRLTPASWLTGSGWTPLFPEDSPSSVLIARDCQQPSFSPDGRFICFILFDALNKAVTSTPHWPQGIAMMNSDGTGEPTILYKVDVMHDEIIPIKCPCFSPDGKLCLR